MPTTSSLTIDHEGLGIPAGSYALPSRGAVDHLGEDTHGRFTEHFAGRLPLAALTAAEAAFLREYFFDQFADRRQRSLEYFGRNVPLRFRDATHDERAAAWAREVASDPHTARSVLVLGPTGTGKTHWAYGALRAVGHAGAWMPWKAVTEADLYARLRPRPGHDSEARFEEIARTQLLFLDDLGAAKPSEWAEEVIYRLVNYRYDHCLPSLFASNLTPKSLPDTLGARVASRLTQMCERIALKGDDLRLTRGQA
ncbi:ATP-binding protein [Streptomyces phaeochromogenes]|uniref:ATP-binding protein n=1 Tax=Streptomyces phaeochromogenes TaxID=1923 RepID=UPI002DD7F6AE|nr:ATP-binding protein [Streptomyces phaeochromogenes]WRZ31362.1 ATP-binding protein [Streptomyces phaeochromogenes]